VNSLTERLKDLDEAIPGQGFKVRFTLGMTEGERSRLPEKPETALKRKNSSEQAKGAAGKIASKSKKAKGTKIPAGK